MGVKLSNTLLLINLKKVNDRILITGKILIPTKINKIVMMSIIEKFIKIKIQELN